MPKVWFEYDAEEEALDLPGDLNSKEAAEILCKIANNKGRFDEAYPNGDIVFVKFKSGDTVRLKVFTDRSPRFTAVKVSDIPTPKEGV